MNGMPEHSDNDSVGWRSRLQIYGVLSKRSVGQSKWMKRFFIVRDGWLLYYPDTEKKDFSRRNVFNTHPKCAIPLGMCSVAPAQEQSQPFAFTISGEEVEGSILTLAAESDFERDRWIDIIEKSKRITWANQQLSDDMIRKLEEHGLAMAKEKQDYFDRLQSEVLELADEKEKTWELERINEALEKEKEKMENFAEEMRIEFEKVKSELDETQMFMKELDTERSELDQQLELKDKSLQVLADEREAILSTLKRQESVTEQLSQEKENLSLTELELKTKLKNIEEETQQLLQEKSEAEMRLKENELRAEELEEEKQMYNEQAQELQTTIKDLKAQKEMTEAELKEEVVARMQAEQRLKDAEGSLHKLGHAVEHETPNVHHEVKEEMVVNVNKLKMFFENLAEEAKVDPDKPVVIKNAIHARKTIARRSKAKKYFERRKSSSMRARSMNMDQILRGSKSMINPRRAKSTFIQGSIDKDQIAIDLQAVPEHISEHF